MNRDPFDDPHFPGHFDIPPVRGPHLLSAVTNRRVRRAGRLIWNGFERWLPVAALIGGTVLLVSIIIRKALS